MELQTDDYADRDSDRKSNGDVHGFILALEEVSEILFGALRSPRRSADAVGITDVFA